MNRAEAVFQFYNAVEAQKYSNNSRVQSIQAEMTYRCLELLNLSADPFLSLATIPCNFANSLSSSPPSTEDDEMPRPSYLLDIGAGSGLSGEILTEEGHEWVGMDISGGMLGQSGTTFSTPYLVAGLIVAC